MQRSAGSYFRKSPPSFSKIKQLTFLPCGKARGSSGRMANAELHQIRSFFLPPESSDLSGSAVWGAGERESPQKKRKEKESRKVRWRRWAPSNGLHLEKKREAGLRLIRFHTPLSLSWGFSNKWGLGHDRQGKAVAMHSSDMTKLEYWLRSCGAGLIDGWFSWWWMFRQLFTAATLVT